MKSGTSLLRVLLAQHRDVFGSFETHWFTDPMRLHWNDPGSRRMQYLIEFFELSDSNYQALCATKREQPHREFVDIVMEYCAIRAGKPRWVEKTPDNIHVWGLIRKQWPDAYLIHVTREYKDCFASWKDRRGDDLDTFLAAATTAYDDIQELLGTTTEHYLEVDYSELASDTESTMRRILTHVGLDWDGACTSIDLKETRTERTKVQNVLGRDSLTAASLTRPIFTDSLGQWRNILNENEISRIDHDLAPWYKILGKRWTTA